MSLAASKSAVLQRLRRANLVHLATHGFFNDRSDAAGADAFGVLGTAAELDSGLVFAGANLDATGGLDSLLTAEEIRELDLRHVELMVLSACETSKGHIRAGQGVVGLLGSLDDAGVNTVVSALWEVPDEETKRLMVRFYQLLLSKEAVRISPAEAMRQAQCEMLENDEAPRSWAAWTVMGTPNQTLP
jgi:CHAT domain-containing protein